MTAKKKRRGLHLISVFGIPLHVDISWFIIVALLTWTLATRYFPSKIKGVESSTYWLLGAIAALGLFISVVIHEFGHALMARHEKMPVEGITLFLFGGVSELGGIPRSPGSEALVTMAGWLISAVLAVVFFVVYRLFPAGSIPSYLAIALFQYLAIVNLALFIFNGIPAFPLDGGRLLRAFLWKVTGNLRRATSWASQTGAGFALVLIVLGVLSIMFGAFVGGLWLALIGLFLRTSAKGSYQQLLLHQTLSGVPVSALMSTDVVSIPESITLQEAIDRFIRKHHHHSFPVRRGDQSFALLSMNDVKHCPPDQWEQRTVGEILDAKDEIAAAAVSPDADALDTFKDLLQSSQGRLVVIDAEGQLCGIISRRDLLHYLTLQSDLDETLAGLPT